MALDLSDPRLLPWWEPRWHSLQARRRAGTLPHALLICGAEGMGKGQFAAALAASLLCSQPLKDGQACGTCHGCRVRANGSHPDLVQVTPEEGKQVIKVDHVRAQNDFLSLTAHYGGHRVSIVSPADRMHAAAANALLKTLEEPPPGVVLLLVTSRPAALPATVRSRCQRLEAPRPDTALALAWLAETVPEAGADAPLLLDLAEGAPCRAAALARAGSLPERNRLLDDLAGVARGQSDPVATAARWLDAPGVDAVLYWLSRCVTDMIRLSLAGSSGNPLNRDRVESLGQWARRSDPGGLWDYLNRVEETQRLVASQANLNAQLLLEDLLIGWHRLTAPGHGSAA